ncbi:MAG: hypothetical protein ACRDLB_08475, partial [Actinomycetota bacterium]
EEPDVDRSRLFAVVRAAFAQRRKTIRRCLVPLVGSLDGAAAALSAAGIPADARAEDLPFEEFVELARAVEAHEANQGK